MAYIKKHSDLNLGRPRAFTSEKEIHDKVAKYKEYLLKNNKPATMAGLAYYLDIDRHTLYNYSKEVEFFHTIKKYRDWIEMGIEELCINKGNGGIIFLAKNYGYNDKQEVEISVVEDLKPLADLLSVGDDDLDD